MKTDSYRYLLEQETATVFAIMIVGRALNICTAEKKQRTEVIEKSPTLLYHLYNKQGRFEAFLQKIKNTHF